MQNEIPKLSHHGLRIYSTARKLAAMAHSQPPGNAELRNQAQRAAISVALNIAEGAGMEGAAKKKFYRTARASALEVVAAYEVASDIGEGVPVDEVTELARPVIAVLTKLLR